FLAVFVAFVATHPVMYVYRRVEWDLENKSWLLDGQLPLYGGGKAWGMYLAWIILCIMACLLVTVFIFLGNLRVIGDKSPATSQLSRSVSSIGSSGIWNGVVAENNRTSFNHDTSGLRSMALRNAAFAVVPLGTGIWSVVCALAPHRLGWLYGVALIMAAFQGILCLVLLVVNMRLLHNSPLTGLLTDRVGKKNDSKPLESELHLNFTRFDNTSTIHLSPYQSRGSSIS
ncbi:hypothetical protein J3B02_001008, partial [Coemansia erecta]